ncbi:Ankyrin [Mycena venus]|uniref:Ankyrin n=1 Tax=Mycena venus TaxID=2733690 RepID=A0A8H6YT85_9AGAR|nr:Ankyrin [Mycena venus]
MAETLGTVASVIQLVDTALKAKEYIQGFVHAPQEQRKLLSEMADLRPLLDELRDRIASSPSSVILERMMSPLADFKATMEQFTNKLGRQDGPLSKFSNRLMWTMWNKKEAQEYLSKFEQFKSLLNSWLLLDLWDIGQQHRRNQGAVLRSIKDVANTVNSSITSISHGISEQQQQMNSVRERVENMTDVVNTMNCGVTHIGDDQRHQMKAAERVQILDWLSPINFFLRKTDISRMRQPGTGGWLLEDPRFQEWVSGSGRTLWCRGIPGAGKTILASMIVDHLSADSEHKDIGVACMYLNHKEEDTQTPTYLISALWRQLVLGRDLGSLPKKLYQQHFEKGTTPSLEEVDGILRDTIAKFSKVYIIVDAIDEYPELQRRILLRRLTAMGPTVNLMITSRPHIPTDPFSFPNIQTLEIRATAEDLRRYVDAHIDMSPRLSKHVQNRPQLQADIHSKINSTVDGMFLLAKLHIESLSTKSTIKAVRDALENLPKDLIDSYDIAIK